MVAPLHSSQARPVLAVHGRLTQSTLGGDAQGVGTAVPVQHSPGWEVVTWAGAGGSMEEQCSRWFLPLQAQYPSSLSAIKCPSLQGTTENSASTKPPKASCAKSRHSNQCQHTQDDSFYKLSHTSVLSTL